MWLIQWLRTNSARNEFGVPVRNFGKVTDEIYRGALPRAEGYRALAGRLGVRSVCSLTELEMDAHRKLALEAGVEEWRHIAFSDRAAPTAERVHEWLAHVRSAKARGPVYTHCMGGRHRTGMLVGVFRVADYGGDVEDGGELRHLSLTRG